MRLITTVGRDASFLGTMALFFSGPSAQIKLERAGFSDRSKKPASPSI
jgi:hypothetical protein